MFRPPLGWIFRALGGYPVDRQQSQFMVDRVAEIFKEQNSFLLALAPEGTRSQVTNWRTGFYHIAVKAGVPIQMIGMDYSRKVIQIMELFYPIGAVDLDLPIIRDRFSEIQGKNLV